LLYAPLPTVDNEPPASSVEALPAQSHAAFLVRWSGQDNPGGSGVATYDIYFSENGGPFQRWLTATPSASALFQGALGKTYAFYSIAIDQAGNREAAPAAPQAQTTVILENQAPVFTPIANQVVVEGATFSLTATATDPDGDAVSYQLGPGAPPGLVLNSVSGQLTWITAEAHGPSTNPVAVIARDNGIPSLTATQTFAIIVLESNSPPSLAGTTNRTIAEGTLLSLALAASDDDLPPQHLTFSLGAGAPAGAAINPTNGLFTWRPTEFQGGTNYSFSIIVSDDGIPSLSATQTFVVIVQDTKADFQLSIGSTAILTNGADSVPLTLQSGVELNEVNLLLHVGGQRLTNLQLTTLAPQVGAANFLPLGEDRYQIQFQRRPEASWQGSVALARVAFAAGPGSQSAVAVLRGEGVTGLRADAPTANGQAGVGRVFIVGPEPILDLARSNQMAALTLYALPGRSYAIERRAGLSSQSPWEFLQSVSPASLRTDLAPQPMTAPAEFFRASALGPAPTLSIRFENGQLVAEWPATCVGCSLFQSDSVNPGARWTPVPIPPVLVNGMYRVTMPAPTSPTFLRLGVSGALSLRVEGGQAVVEWSAGCTGCILLQSPTLGPGAVWTPSAVQPQLVNDRYRVVLPLTQQRLFLRLGVPPP
jgi:hypothetical protein